MKKRVTIIILIIVSLSIIINLYSLSFSDNKNKIEKVSTKETFTDKENMLSIMVIDENGSYEETQDRTSWPDPSTYEYYKSECTDSEGTIIPSEEAVTFENNTIHIKTKNTIYCTLYFADKNFNPLPPLEMLQKTTNNQYLKTAYDGDELLRYIGTYTDANEHRLNNYICFGTTDIEECTKTNPDEYMYRIIGITTDNVNQELELQKDQLKLIKASKSIYKQWFNSQNDLYNWNQSILKQYLNDDFLKTITGTLGIHKWSDLITNPKWYMEYLGEISTNLNPKEMNEGFCNGKIGLMYASDYVNAFKSDSRDNWLFIQNGWSGNPAENEWTMSRRGVDIINYAWRVYSGTLMANRVSSAYAIRPVFYLIPDITLSGKGTEENPFLISTP